MDLEVINQIEGVEKLIEVFGRFPSFHDAEILRIILDRKGNGHFKPTLEATVRTCQITNELDENRRYILKNHCLVDFKFSEIAELKLNGFNHQNVINELVIEKITDKHRKIYKTENEYAKEWVKQMIESHNFYVELVYSHGINGSFLCKSIEVLSVKRLSPEEVKQIGLSGKGRNGV
jgi:hypothetical protein